jgi:hydrogenase/urease accessory protein HupE
VWGGIPPHSGSQNHQQNHYKTITMNIPKPHLTKPLRILLHWSLGLLIVLSLNKPSQAHWADLAVADIHIQPQTVELNLTIPTGLVRQFDDDKNQQLSPTEVTNHQTELRKFFDDRLQFTIGENKNSVKTIESTAVNNSLSNLIASPNTHSGLKLQYQWAEPINQLQVHYDLFIPGVNTARCLAQVFRNGTVENVVFTPESKNAALIDSPIIQQITSFIRLGVEHIWTGYDHILFLISLLMLGGELPYLLKIVTAFSISHFFTLSLSALNIISLPSRWVEIAIALSILYIAAENLWRKEPNQQRWQLTFAFGLIHGLGFSSALKELDLPQSNLATSLLSFGLGIELGQFAIVIAVYFAMKYLSKFPWDLPIRRLVSIGVIAMSLVWFWERAFVG